MNKYFRLLEEGEVIQAGDGFFNEDGKFVQFLPCTVGQISKVHLSVRPSKEHRAKALKLIGPYPQPETKPEEIKKCPIMRSPDEIPEFWNKLPEMATSAHITYSSIAKRFRDERDQARKELQELFAKKSEPKEELRWITDRQSSEDDGDKFGHVLSIDRSGEVHIRLYNSWSHEHVGWLPTNVLPPYTPAKPSVPTLEEWIVHRWMEISPEEHGDMKDKDIRLWHAKQGMAYQKMVMEQEQSKK